MILSGRPFRIQSDANWTPLLATPNHPEYPAAHGCLTSAEAEVFAAFLGTNQIDLDLTRTVPNLHPAVAWRCSVRRWREQHGQPADYLLLLDCCVLVSSAQI